LIRQGAEPSQSKRFWGTSGSRITRNPQSGRQRKPGIVAGTQRRHSPDYIEVRKRIAGGANGKIVAARAYWNQGQLWYKQRDPRGPRNTLGPVPIGAAPIPGA